MPHTITKKHRPKRPDLRPSDKTRKKDNRRKADALDVTELRVVKRRKEDGPKREREVIAAAAPLKKTPAEKTAMGDPVTLPLGPSPKSPAYERAEWPSSSGGHRTAENP